MGDTSTARTLDQFYKDCAREPLPFEEIRDAILININRGYLECTSLFADERELAYAIQEVTRGFWGLNDSITPKYLYALYQQRIVGVYRIKKQTKQVRKKKQVHTVPCYYTFLDVWREDYPTFDRLPSRRKDRELANKLYQACRKDAEGKVAAAPSYDELPNDLKAEVRAFFGKLNKGETYEKKLKLLVIRKYLVVEAIGDTDPDARMNELVGRRIVKTYTDQNGDLKSSSPNGQNPRSYSLDLLSGR